MRKWTVLALLLPFAAIGADAPQLKLLVPMYFYPLPGDAQWQAVADAGASVDVVAIVNPGNGLQVPLSEGDHENYNEAQNLLHNAGVKMVGYVSSNYGCESLEEVQGHVDEYFNNANFAYITGIFIDETENDLVNDDGDSPCPGTVGAGFDYQAYYTAISEHIRSHARFDMIVCNPGTDVPDEYLAICDVIVSFESRGENFESDAAGDGQSAPDADPGRYALLIHDSPALDRAAIDSWLALAIERNYGYLHFTDDDGWSKLPGYFSQLVDAVECRNSAHAGATCDAQPPGTDGRNGHDVGDDSDGGGGGGGAAAIPLALPLLFRRRRAAR